MGAGVFPVKASASLQDVSFLVSCCCVRYFSELKDVCSIMDAKSDTAINVVAALIYKDGRLLVCQRRRDAAFPLKWEFPGGKVEGGESDIDALRRELQEELAIETGSAVLVYQHEHSYANGPRVSLRFYYVRDFAGEVTNRVFEQISWSKLTDLRMLDFLEGDRPIIEELLSGREPGFLRRNEPA